MHLGEFQRALADCNPLCVCFQHIGPTLIDFRNYTLACHSSLNNGQLSTAIYVHKSSTYSIRTSPDLQAQITVVQLHLPGNNSVTVCNVYNQPAFHLDVAQLLNYITSLTGPVMLLGDFNSHSPIWDS